MAMGVMAARNVRGGRYLLLVVLLAAGGMAGSCQRQEPGAAAAPPAPGASPDAAAAPAAQPQTAIPAPPTANGTKDVDRKVIEALDTNLKELVVDRQELEKVLNFLRDNMAVNMYVNWPALERAGIDRRTPVTLSLREVPFRKTLAMLLSQLGPGNVAAYAVEDGVLTISTQADLESHQALVVRVYDIRDMLVQPSDIPAPQFAPLSAPAATPSVPTVTNPGASPPSGFGGTTGGLFGEQAPGDGPSPAAQRRATFVAALGDTLKTAVAPDSWDAKGGKGALRELNGQFIIQQTEPNQRAVKQLLDQLRAARAIQIAIEARLYLIDDATFAALGLKESAPATPAAVKSIAPIILDDQQLAPALARLQAAPGAWGVTMPRVTLFNSQNGFIAATNQQNIVAGWKKQKDDAGKESQTLDVQTLSSGIIFGITATTSADRKNVVLALAPSIRVLEKIDTFTLSTTAPAADHPGLPTDPFVQIPTVHDASLSTMLSVPSGKTALIGGMKLAGDLGNLDKNGFQTIAGANAPATPLTVRNMVLLVRPEVIIHHEIDTPAEPDAVNPGAAGGGGAKGLP